MEILSLLSFISVSISMVVLVCYVKSNQYNISLEELPLTSKLNKVKSPRDIETDNNTFNEARSRVTRKDDAERLICNDDGKSASVQALLRSLISTSYGASFLLALLCLNIGMSVVENLIFLFYRSLHQGTYTM